MIETEQILLTVISHPEDVQDEVQQIHELFEAGMKSFHLRKPSWSAERLRSLTALIDERWHHKIAVHITSDKDSWANWKGRWHGQGQHSSSVHSWNEYKGLPEHTSYCFIGPVFDSISKPDYSQNESLWNTETLEIPAIAIGGINSHNIQKALEMGFSGVAVLGAIWNQQQAATNFQTLKQMIERQAV